MFNFLNTTTKIKFQVQLTIHALLQIPPLYGTVFIKIKMKPSLKVITSKQLINQNSVIWEQTFSFECDFKIDKNTNILVDKLLRLSIRQEAKGTLKESRIGVITINLAELAGMRKTNKIFQVQESKLNSTLNVTIEMRQLSGAPTFKVPNNTETQHQFLSPLKFVNHNNNNTNNDENSEDDESSADTITSNRNNADIVNEILEKNTDVDVKKILDTTKIFEEPNSIAQPIEKKT